MGKPAPTEATRAFCRLLCDIDLGFDDAPTPGQALRGTLSRSLVAISIWQHQGYVLGDSVSIAVYARRFLEAATTALLSRIDPLRVLALRELQRGGSYQLTKRNLLAIQWSGDILPSGERGDGMSIRDCDPQKLDRALFSTLVSLTVWKPAIESLQNLLSTEAHPTDWQLDLLAIDPEEFAKKAVGVLNGNYSYFSKGIHIEAIDRRRSIFNIDDTKTHIANATQWLSFCAAALCCSSLVAYAPRDAYILKWFRQIEAQFGGI